MKFHNYHSAKSISGSKNSIHVCIRQLHSEILRTRFTTENDSLSLSECCWKENLQIKVAALTQQPKQMVELSTLSQTTLLKYLKGLITKISFQNLQNLKFDNHKRTRILLALWLDLCSKFSWFSHGRWRDVKLTVG